MSVIGGEREMTLEEHVYNLPVHHRARREYETLVARVELALSGKPWRSLDPSGDSGPEDEPAGPVPGARTALQQKLMAETRASSESVATVYRAYFIGLRALCVQGLTGAAVTWIDRILAETRRGANR